MDVEMDVGEGREEEIREVHGDSRRLVHNGKYMYMKQLSEVRSEAPTQSTCVCISSPLSKSSNPV